MDLERNTPALRPLRGKEPIQQWVSRFARRDPDRARRYEQALALFLDYEGPGGRADWVEASYVAAKSPNTLRAYRFAISEFFEFLVQIHDGRVVPPHEVTRKDAFDYAEWLANRGRRGSKWSFGIESEKLRDGDRTDELAVYEAIVRLGSAARFETIAKALPPAVRRAHPRGYDQVTTSVVDEQWLSHVLRQLIVGAVVERSPKMVELRREDPRAGLDASNPIDPDLFVYRRVELRPCSRATIEQRLTALSSFWKVMQKGENAGPKALLEYDVFEDALRRARRGVAEEKRASSVERRPTPELLRRLIGAAQGNRLADKRNVALLWFLLLTGGRVTETLNLRRGAPRSEYERKTWGGWIETSKEPFVVVFVGKGNKRRRIALPPYAYRALVAFWQALATRAEKATPDVPAYRYKLLLEEPDAPLFPPAGLWGANRTGEETPNGPWGYRRSMRRPAISRLLCKLARKAGLDETERRRIHPHGFRHAAAEAMAAGGIPLEEIKVKLGHQSVTTTEQYLPPEEDVVQRSGEDEILEWLGAEPPPPVPGIVPAAPEVVTTYVEDVEEPEAEVMAARPSPEPTPTHLLPEGPEPPGRPYPLPELPSGLVAIGGDGDVSAPSPTGPYEDLAEGRKPGDIVWSAKPQARWIEKHYPLTPQRFGVGKESLLVWWNPQAPLPWPVLSPAQAYPELGVETVLLSKLEALYDRWSTSRPTSTLALAQWLYFLGHLTVGLERRIEGAYSWVTFNAVGRIGEDFRGHDDDWLARWFEKNAHTFAVAQSRFKSVPMPEPREPAEEYWERVREDIAVAGAVPTVPQLPEWFWEQDPTHAIWLRSAAEWRAFADWIEGLTRGSEERDVHRDEQLDLFERSQDAKRERATGLLWQLFSFVDELGDPSTSDADRDRIAQSMRALRELLAQEGVRTPTKAPGAPEARSKRIRDLVHAAYPSRKPRPEGNVLGDSRLFRADALRIDRSKHTLSHTKDFLEQFGREYGGLDSECVMRRVARALWERVRPWEYPEGEAPSRRMTPREERRELFIVQLAHLAHVVPCPEDVEARMVAEGYKAPSPSQIAKYVNDRICDVAFGREDVGDEVAADVLESYYEHLPEPDDPRVAAQLARLREQRREWERTGRPTEERTAEQKAQRRRQRAQRRNAGRVMPHPLRLVAAAFWPV